MNLTLTVFGKNLEREKKWIQELKTVLSGLNEFRELTIRGASEGENLGQIVFLDPEMNELEQVLSGIDRRNRVLYLIVDGNEDTSVPRLVKEGKVDDVVVAPFRSLEILSKFRSFEQVQLLNEVTHLNTTFSGVLQKLTEDLNIAERLHKAKAPKRFSHIKGFQVLSRYLAGSRSGGDYFDLIESSDHSSYSLFLSDSSSYGLSSAVMSALLRVMAKFTAEKGGKSGEATKSMGLIYDELALILGDNDQLSLFYATLSRKSRVLRYLSLGETLVLYADSGREFEILPSQGGALTRISGFVPNSEGELKLSPQGRFAVVSQGWVNQLGGKNEVQNLLNEFRNKEAADSLNELVFRVQSQFKEEGEMPLKDCTVMILEPNGVSLTDCELKPES